MLNDTKSLLEHLLSLMKYWLFIISAQSSDNSNASNSDTPFINLNRKYEFTLDGFYVLLFAVNMLSLGFHICFLLLLLKLAYASPLVLIALDCSFSVRKGF